ncbi:glycosyltransferase family 2 protein [Streptacidiphilus sp. EB129]|uniref:glycosyltransferase family 2 protein n=1 Tax=Streptacidiphilus sp. EB129 TaxID=3156262 RepID=UPI003515991B
MTQRHSDDPPVLDIVIVNWNTGACLRECLRSVADARRTAYTLHAVVVVDNASTDDSMDAVADLNRQPGLPLRFLRNRDNRGFAVACNQGARAAKDAGPAGYVLFLNPDTVLFPETLDLAVGFLHRPEQARVGICGGQMVGDGGEFESSCSRFPTLPMALAKTTGLARLMPGRVPRQRLSPAETGGSGPVDQVIGAFFLIRRPLFDRLGGFDERYFVYYEEVDLAYRARRAGYGCYFLADALVRHRGGVSTGQVPGRRLFYSLRSRTEYARAHWPRRQAWALMALILGVELPVRAVRALGPAPGPAGGRTGELRAVAEAARCYGGYAVGLTASALRPARG